MNSQATSPGIGAKSNTEASTAINFLLAWGSLGSGNGQFTQPSGVAVDRAGNVYVSDNNSRIQKFDSYGNFLLKWGSQGAGIGQFRDPYGVAVDKSDNDNVYVADKTNQRIQKFTSTGVFIAAWGSLGASNGQFNQPSAVAVDGAGNVYVADTANHRIQKFTSTGVFIAAWGSLGAGNGQFNQPSGVAVNGAGDVFVVDFNNSRIQKFTSTGSFITTWGSFGSSNGQFNKPDSVATDTEGNVYVVEQGNSRVQKFTATGSFIATWGSAGSGNGQFDVPLGVAVNNAGNVYVTDYYNHRIQKFGCKCESANVFNQAVGSPVRALNGQHSPYSVTTGDFNGDGSQDLAVGIVGPTSTSLRILLGNGSGGFSPDYYSWVNNGSIPPPIAVGDFNGDGKQDLAVADYLSNNVKLLLGNSGILFADAVGFSVGNTPRSLAVGDFNGDGKQDLAVANANSNNVTILLGNGNGGFAPAAGSSVSVGNSPSAVAVGDFNGDGKQDLTVANFGGNSVTILLGNGSGGFAPAAGSPVTAAQPTSVRVGDFNGDGKQDLAVANANSNNIAILLGNGSGGFAPAAGSPVSMGNSPSAVAVGDFNGDGKQDLAVSNNLSSNVTILSGNGNGGFAPAAGSPVNVGSGSSSVAVGDFNGDDRQDFAVANYSSETLTILLNNCAPTISAVATSRQQGSTVSNSTIATVSDVDQAAGKLGVRVNNAASATVNGVTVSNLVNTSDTITADIVADCTATNASFTLTVTDSLGATATATLSVTVTANTAPTIGTYADRTIESRNWGFVPTSVPADNGTLAGVTVSVSPGFFTGIVRVSRAGVVSITNAGPNGSYTVTVTAWDNCGLSTSRSFKLTVNTPATCPNFGFSPPAGSPISVGTNPASVARGDFNGDNRLDVAVPNYGSNNVAILLGNGNGGFTPAAGSPISTGTGPSPLAIGDFNGDGRQDLAIPNFGSNNVTILLGNGSGGFTPAAGSPVNAGNGPRSVVVSDLNGDARQDLAVANANSNNVTILLGNGSGGFVPAAGSPVNAGSAPLSVAAGDFNGDGKQDLAAANVASNNVTILLGNGSGMFAQAAGSPVSAGNSPYSVAEGDFNGDGRLDIAVANSSSNNVTILLGNGSGGFTQPSGSPVNAGNGPRSVVVGDFNGDGRQDLAVANSSSNNITILLGNGSGGFTPAAGSPINAGSAPLYVAVGDFNSDGKQDIAAANIASNNVTILLNNCVPMIAAGTVLAQQGSPTGTPLPLATVSDTEDAVGSLSVAAITGGTATGITLGPLTNISGTISATVAASCTATSGTLRLQITDSGGLTATSDLQVNVTLNDPPTVGTYANQTVTLSGNVTITPTTAPTDNGTIASLTAAASAGFFSGIFSVNPSTGAVTISNAGPVGSYTVTVTALDNCGLSTRQTFKLTVNPPVACASFGFSPSAGSPVSVGNSPYATVVGDFNRDGRQDIAVANAASNDVTILLGNGSGGFSPAPGSPVSVGNSPYAVAVGDFNGDGRQDLAVANGDTNNVTILLGNGNGGFTPAAGSPVSVGNKPYALAVGDFNGDGRQDLAIPNFGSNNVTILLGNGSGGFTPAAGSPVNAGNGPRSVAVGDFNGDGRLDLAVANVNSGNVTILLGNGSGGFTPAVGSPLSVGGGPLSIAVGDFNGDSRQDLTVANNISNNVTILLGNGNGGFAQSAGSLVSVGNSPYAVLVGDFNGDGKLDIAAANANANNVTILLGNGSGGFTPAAGSPVSVGSGPLSVAVGDFNGDGKQDLATANANANNLTILLNQCVPAISTVAISRQQGSATSNSTIATVSDGDQIISTLIIRVNNAINATVNGVTVSNLVNTVGTITADIAASSTATNASFTLMVTNNKGATATATLNVAVTQVASVTSVSAASYYGTALASDSIVSAFGVNLATTTQAAARLPLPTTLAGTTVRVRDSAGVERLAPLFYVSPQQVNYLIPAGTANGTATVTITNGAGANLTGTVQITSVAPGLFAANADGQGPPAGYALRVKADGTQVTEPITRWDAAQNRHLLTPLDLGASNEQMFLVLFGTGFRRVSAPSAVSAKIEGVEVAVSYAGAQGEFVGLDQLNLLVPRSLIGYGELDIILTVDGKTANTVKINIGGPVPTTVSTVTPQGGNVTLQEKATAIFPAGSFDQETKVTVSATNTPETKEDFDVTASLFDPGPHLPYQLRINTGKQPPALDFEVIFQVPDSFVNSLPPNAELQVFAQIFEDSENEVLDSFELFSSMYDQSAKTVRVTLPPQAFTNERNRDGIYEAIIILGTILTRPSSQMEQMKQSQLMNVRGTTDESRRVATSPLPGTQLSNNDLLCGCKGSLLGYPLVRDPWHLQADDPVKNFLVVTSKFTPIVKPVKGAHWGTDYVASKGEPVLAVADGTVSVVPEKPQEKNIPNRTGGAKVGITVEGQVQGSAQNTGLVFEVFIDGISVGKATFGVPQTITVNNQRGGRHLLTVLLTGSPQPKARLDWTVKLSGFTFEDGSTSISGDYPEVLSRFPLGQWNVAVSVKLGWGYYVVVQHDDGGKTVYAHLLTSSYPFLKEGYTVKKGQVIGYADSSGGSTGDHLHLEYILFGAINDYRGKVDPDPCIGGNVKVGITVEGQVQGTTQNIVFSVLMDGISVGKITFGAPQTITVNNQRGGRHLLTILGDGKIPPKARLDWTVKLSGLTFEEGSTSKSDYFENDLDYPITPLIGQWNIAVPVGCGIIIPP
ncbi:MAG: VCBS repeat-containing protein [Blastocatellia bacterium]|nr:VCBS repeat-containing protein [Blastocatellia bacterium]